MTLEERVTQLENRLDNLQASFIQAQKNMIPVTEKADTTPTLSQQIEEITPYKETKTAYIEDTEITFENVPTGNLSVFSTVSVYNVNRDEGTVIIDFAPLEEVTEFTIMVQ